MPGPCSYQGCDKTGCRSGRAGTYYCKKRKHIEEGMVLGYVAKDAIYQLKVSRGEGGETSSAREGGGEGTEMRNLARSRSPLPAIGTIRELEAIYACRRASLTLTPHAPAHFP